MNEVMYTVLVPVYRSMNMLPILFDRVVASMEALGQTFELLLVEDCGGDDSWSIIENLIEQDSRVRGIKLSRNFGQHNALLAGIRNARGEFIITLDDDLQNPPEQITLLVEQLKNNDLVYGVPAEERHGFFRDFASKLTKSMIQKSLGNPNAKHISAFRLFRTKLRSGFELFTGPSVNIDVLLSWSTDKIVACYVERVSREVGESGYNFKRLLIHALNMITGFSTLPLRIASIVGLFFTCFGFFVLLYVIIRYLLTGGAVPGFSFIASIISIYSGAQLLALGIIGEYLARMFNKQMGRPTYNIEKVTSKDSF